MKTVVKFPKCHWPRHQIVYHVQNTRKSYIDALRTTNMTKTDIYMCIYIYIRAFRVLFSVLNRPFVNVSIELNLYFPLTVISLSGWKNTPMFCYDKTLLFYELNGRLGSSAIIPDIVFPYKRGCTYVNIVKRSSNHHRFTFNKYTCMFHLQKLQITLLLK